MITTSIITVNYNQTNITIEFLKSVKKHAAEDTVEVIVVDNGSITDDREAFKDIYPSLKYIRSEKNLGFAGGNNLGINDAKGQYLLFLNNDTEITKNFITVMIEEFEANPGIGILSPLILYHENKTKIQYAGFSRMNYLLARNRQIGLKEDNVGQYKDYSRETSFVHGAAMMCKRSDLKKTGLMEENYFLYYEEIDWCEKFRKAGMKIWFTGKAHIYHKESMSVGKESDIKTYFMHRNRLLFIRKNTNFLNVLIFSTYFIGFVCPKTIVSFLVNGKKNLVPQIFRAIVWNFRHSVSSPKTGFKPFTT